MAAEGLSSRVVSCQGGFAVEVPTARVERAAEILDAYDRENPETVAAAPVEALGPTISATGLVVSCLLVAFFLVTGPRDAGGIWFERGSADAAKILAGEVWRCVTALTLHADLRHVASNAVSGTFFLGAVCAALGPGVGLALVLAAGALGNFGNALLHETGHDSVGASTAVFAAVGIICARAFFRRARGHDTRRRRSAWVAFAAGFALLAMLGTAGERVDFWAHGFGLAAGCLLGLPVVHFAREGPGAAAQTAFGLFAAALLAASWVQAL